MNTLGILVSLVLISNAACDVVVANEKSTSLVKDQGFTLNCIVDGNDTFDQWSNPLYKSSVQSDPNIRYENNGDHHNLVIVSMNVFIAGIWTCSSKEGRSDNTTLTFAPSLVTPTETQQNLTKDQPGAIYIDIRGYPPPDFVWTKDGVELVTTGRYSVASNGTLLISNVKSGDDGTYSAKGMKKFFHKSSGDIVVTLLVAPSINGIRIQENRTVGGNISFECSATGVPKPKVTWKKGSDDVNNGGRFTISDTGLLITDIMVSDVGDYKCVASNSVGTKELTSSLLSVHVPPEIEAISNQEVEKGKSLSVSCKATGIPAPTVEWSKDGNILLSPQQEKLPGESTLKLTNIQTNQSGAYQCSAMNAAVDSMGKVIKRSQSIVVNVVYPPQFGEIKETVNVRLNSPVTINCSASGVPKPGIKLSHGGKDIQATVTNTSSQSTLMYSIDNTNADDLGVYTCTASSRLNTITKDITLSVPLDRPEISGVSTTCNGVSFSWHRDTQNYIQVKEYAVTVSRSADQVQVKFSQESNITSQKTFTDLDEDTEFELAVEQKTDVDNIGYKSTKKITTTKCPLKNITDIDIDGNTVTVYWPEATMTIDNYTIKYRIKGTHDWRRLTAEKISIKVSGLGYGTYEFQVFYRVAGSEMLYTKIRDVQILPVTTAPTPTNNRTAELSTAPAPATDRTTQLGTKMTEEPPTTERLPPGKVARKGGLSGGAIAAIVIVIILLVLIAVDIFCCFFNQCGVVHMCAAACAGKGREKYTVDGSPEEGTKLKEIDEEGKEDPEA